jgi:signal transduction histidine kinase/HAMP domain-containing protein
MEAGVPFALFSGVQILALAAALGVGALALATRRPGPRACLLLGGLLLAVSHGLTGATFDGASAWTLPYLLRAAGYVVTAAGVGLVPATAPLVVAPLGAPATPAFVAAGAALLVALAATRSRGRDRWLLVGAFVLAAGAEALGEPARTSDTAAVVLLLLRLGWVVGTTAYLFRRAERSVLAKVVGTIALGVALLGAVAGGAAGQLAADNLAQEQIRAIRQVGEGQRIALEDEASGDVLDRANSLVGVLFPSAAELNSPPEVQRARAAERERELRILLEQTSSQPDVIFGRITVVDGRRVGDLRRRAGGATVPLDPTAASLLSDGPVVGEALDRGQAVSTPLLLLGQQPQLLLLAVVPYREAAPRGIGARAAVYAVPVTDARLRVIAQTTAFDATLLVDGEPIATSLEGPDRSRLEPVVARYDERDVDSRLATVQDDLTIRADGSEPTVHYEPVATSRGDVIGVLALSAPSGVVLEGQRDLLSTIVGLVVAVGALAVLVGVLLARRVVRPVRELTLAAARIRRGDLTTRAGVRTVDEVGVLARTFDAMTATIEATTADLRRGAEEQRALAGRLETVLDSIGDAIVIVDGAGRVSGANPAAAALLGAPVEDLVGSDVTAVVRSFDGPLVGRSGERTLTGVLRPAAGPMVPVAVVQSTLAAGDGSVVVLRDLSREVEVERMKTEFLSNISHELRTPLTPIRGYAEILQRRPDLPPEDTSRFAGTILDSTLRMARVVDLLVDVAALEAGRVVPEPRATKVATLVDGRVDAWRDKISGRDFRRRVARGLPDVMVDPAWVTKALDELIDNAVKYGGSGPITVSAVMAGERVRLTVRDSGSGVPADRMGALFADFEQVDGSATRETGGLGLGLSFVRRVSEVAGFTTHVESGPRGAAFSLDLPAVPTPPAPRSRRRPGGPARSRRTTRPPLLR